MSRFVGRQNELKRLSDLQKKKTASFVVIRGKRRIGKSRLAEELSKHFDKFYILCDDILSQRPNEHVS